MHGTVLNRLLIEKMHLTFFIFCVQFALRLGIRRVVGGIWCVGAGETSLRPKNSGNLVLYLLGNSSVKLDVGLYRDWTPCVAAGVAWYSIPHKVIRVIN